MKTSTRTILRDYGGTVVIAVGLALFIRSKVIEAYRIPSSTMKPTLIAGDTLFVAKWPFWIGKTPTLQRGEIVVFSGSPGPGRAEIDYIKRVVALPGDTVSLKNGLVNLNGRTLGKSPDSKEICSKERISESVIYEICRDTPLMDDFGPEKIPADSIFVLGDSRSNPDEKKTRKGWGIVPISAVKGKALWIWLSIEPHPEVQSTFKWIPQFRWERMFRRIQ